MKLRSKILGYTLPLILIPLLITALAVYYFIIRANQIQAQDQRNQIVNEALVNIGQETDSIREDIKLLSSLPAFVSYLENQSAKTESTESILIRDESQARSLLGLFFKQNPYYLEVSLIDERGQEKIKFSRLEGNQKLRDLSGQAFFRRTLITGAIESPVYEYQPDRFATVFTKRVGDKGFPGIILLKIDTATFLSSMRPLLKRDLQTFIFDDRGTVLALSLDSNESKDAIKKIDLPAKATRVFENSSSGSGSERVNVGNRQLVFSVLPSESFSQFSTIEKQAGSNWFLGLFEPKLSSGIPFSFQVVFFSTLLLTIVGLLWVTAKASKRITVPLELVSTATGKISRGQTDLKLDIKTGDEVEDLANALTKMNGELQDYQKRLVQSTKLATMGEMTSEISHEIQNRISGISLWLQHLDSEMEEDDPKREYLDEMKQGLSGFMEMLRSLKSYYQDPILDLEVINLNQLLESSLPFIQEKLDEKGAVVKTKFESDLPPVKADAEKLKSAILNLLINAVHSLNEAGEVEVRTENVGGEGIGLKISDNGNGIGEKDLSRIFYPFFSTKSGGSGLGLSICSNIISAHKGRIEVESELAKGTTFKIFLPQVDED